MLSPITTHILDTSRGCPAEGVAVHLSVKEAGTWTGLAEGITDADGRVTDLLQPGSLTVGTYRLTFDIGAYHQVLGVTSFYPEVTVVFHIGAPDEHYHVPLLLNPFGYATYRGS
jgi:5-hydroxyisourate hydrolase